MAPLYSFELLQGAIATGGNLAFTVPPGFVAVVRDVVLHNGGTVGQGVQGAEVYDSEFQIITQVWYPVAVAGIDHHWVGHQVVNQGDEIIAHAVDSNWRVRISGYLLTTP